MKIGATGVPDGSLSSCLVEGDAIEVRGFKRNKSRAILFSILLQSVAVAALVIFPLLGKGERIPVRIFVERPPYRLGSAHPESGDTHRQQQRTSPCLFCKTATTVEFLVAHQNANRESRLGEAPVVGDGPAGIPGDVPNDLEPPPNYPPPPQIAATETPENQRIYVGKIDPARLTRRVEPIYPHLGVQLRRETRVELRAVISIDGSIQSLQVLSGDPLFFQSAIEAVSQWQYTPTILNGKPVEVDTRITVIYSLK
jgi:periplasmic protein TonB